MKLSDLLKSEIESVELTTDPNGHTRVKFSPDVLREINVYLKAELDQAYTDWTPKWNDSVENLETYRTVKIPIPDGGSSIYPAPIARIPADQIIASVYNAIMKPRPIFSIDAYLDAEYSVPQGAPGQQIPPTGPAMVTAVPTKAETVAHRLEQGYDFIVRERINLGDKLLKGVRAAVIGQPFWWKVNADPEERTTIAAKGEGGIIDLNDKYEETKLRGDIVKWYLVPYTNCMRPIDQDDNDQSPWFAERTAWRPDTLAKKFVAGDLFLTTEEEAPQLVAFTVDKQDEFKARSAQTTEKKVASTPAQVCPTWLTWFYWDVQYVDPQNPADNNGKKITKIKRLSLLGDFHLGVGKLMTCWLNPNEHQCRPYELVDQMDDGDCTVGRLKYHQTMFTYAAQSEIQNAHHANNIGYWHDPNIPDLADHFAKGKVVRIGDSVPGIHKTEWGTYRAGEQHNSLLELLKFFLSMSQLDSRENDFTMGGRPPGRTSPNTVAQVYQHAEETKTMFIARLSGKLSRLLRLDAETRRQYQPLGETLPVWEPGAKAASEIPFRFPVGDVLDNFRMALTAADDVLTAEKDPEKVMMRKNALMRDGEYIAKVATAIFNLQQPLPPSGVALFTKVMKRDQQLMRALMGQMVTDEESYDLTPEIEAILAERQQALMQQQAMQQQQMMQGDPNAQGAAGQQPANPAAPAGPGGAPSGPPQAQGGPVVSAPPPPPPAALPGPGVSAPVQ